jgi:Fe-S-cluster containining protein
MRALWQGLEEIFREVDAAFLETKRQFPKEVRCKPGCVDCCYALFDLSLAEAFLLHREFRQRPRKVRREVLRRLEKYEKEWQKKAPEVITPFVLSTVKIRCPLLDNNKRCVLYEVRPVTCRLYGIPVAIEGETFVCGHSGFEPGRKYPTVLFHKVQERLSALSEKIVPQGGSLRVSLGNALRGLFPGVHLLAE